MDLDDQNNEDWQDAMEQADWDYHQDQQLKSWEARWSGVLRTAKVATLDAMQKEQFLIWEHELSQPNYYDYFLEEVTR